MCDSPRDSGRGCTAIRAVLAPRFAHRVPAIRAAIGAAIRALCARDSRALLELHVCVACAQIFAPPRPRLDADERARDRERSILNCSIKIGDGVNEWN